MKTKTGSEIITYPVILDWICRKKQLPWFVLMIVFFLIVLYIVTGWVFSHGLCCADDALHAVVAKNLANGLGYSSSIQENSWQYKLTLFDPRIGTGPMSILPAAVVIKLFGNKYWSPGISHVLLWASISICIGILIHRIFRDPPKQTAAIIVFFILSYIFTAYHFEQWFALLGEIPASFLIILALLIYFEKDSKVNLFFTGVCFSLAGLAKLIALIAFGSFIIYFLISPLHMNKENSMKELRKNLTSLIIIALGFIIPFLIFEIWKIISFGLPLYLENLSDNLDYVKDLGMNSNQRTVPTFNQRIDDMKNYFGLNFPFIILVLLYTDYLLRKDHKKFKLYNALIIIIFFFSFYWLFFSLGWKRYFLIPVILIAFALSIPYLSNSVRHIEKGLYTLLLFSLILYNINSIDTFFPFRVNPLYIRSASTQALVELGNTLAPEHDQEPFVTQYWATAADVEYLLNDSGNFTTFLDPQINYEKSQFIVLNSKFLFSSDEELMNYLSLCNVNYFGKLEENPYYYIYAVCNPN